MFDVYAGKSELCWTRRDGVARKLYLTAKEYSEGAIRALNFEAVEGSLEELSKPRTLAVSESFAVALLSLLVITVVIVTLRSLSAATSNPVDHLKAE